MTKFRLWLPWTLRPTLADTRFHQGSLQTCASSTWTTPKTRKSRQFATSTWLPLACPKTCERRFRRCWWTCTRTSERTSRLMSNDTTNSLPGTSSVWLWIWKSTTTSNRPTLCRKPCTTKSCGASETNWSTRTQWIDSTLKSATPFERHSNSLSPTQCTQWLKISPPSQRFQLKTCNSKLTRP